MKFVLEVYEGRVGARGEIQVAKDGACEEWPDFIDLGISIRGQPHASRTHLRVNIDCKHVRLPSLRIYQFVRWRRDLTEENAKRPCNAFDA